MRAFPVVMPSGMRYWTVADDGWEVVEDAVVRRWGGVLPPVVPGDRAGVCRRAKSPGAMAARSPAVRGIGPETAATVVGP